MLLIVSIVLYCIVSVCWLYDVSYRTLTPYNLLPYNHNTYNAMACDMRIYGHVLGIVAVGHMLGCIDYV